MLVPLAAATTRYTSPAQSYATTDGLEAGGLSAAEGTAAVLLLPAAKEWIPAAALGERPPAPKRGTPPGAALPLEGGFDQLWPTGGLGRTGVDQLCPAGRRAGVTRALPAYSRKTALSGPSECRVLVQVGQLDAWIIVFNPNHRAALVMSITSVLADRSTPALTRAT